MNPRDLGSTSRPVTLISTHAEQDVADMIAASPAIGFLSKIAMTRRSSTLSSSTRSGHRCDLHRNNLSIAQLQLTGTSGVRLAGGLVGRQR